VPLLARLAVISGDSHCLASKQWHPNSVLKPVPEKTDPASAKLRIAVIPVGLDEREAAGDGTMKMQETSSS